MNYSDSVKRMQPQKFSKHAENERSKKMDDLLKKALVGAAIDNLKGGWEHKQDADRLKELYESYATNYNLRPGMLVQWKEGLKNRKFPKYNEPAVLLEVVLGQRDTEAEIGIQCHREPLEARLGVVDPAGEFEGWWVDMNRLEPYTGE